MKNFESVLAPQLNDYIAYRQQRGYSPEPARSYLIAFDRYVKNNRIKPGEFEASFFLEFRDSLKMEPKSINSVMGAVNVFFKYMVRTDRCHQNPLQDIPPVKQPSYAPYLFSARQTDRLIEAVCNRIRKEPVYFLKDLAEYVAIVLIARCGLRIKEPLRLRLNHYRPGERSIYIEKTKFKKDRLIPVPKSAAEEIDNYLAVRNAFLPEDQNRYLFVRNKQKGLNDNRLRWVFHRAVHDIGLCRPRQVIGHMVFASPTPHSLRHSFAVNTLKRIKERGHCPNHALPVLAAYLGHVSYHYTAHYLKFIDAEQRQGLLDFTSSQTEDR
jgi:site-specific recombinase XerD